MTFFWHVYEPTVLIQLKPELHGSLRLLHSFMSAEHTERQLKQWHFHRRMIVQRFNPNGQTCRVYFHPVIFKKIIMQLSIYLLVVILSALFTVAPICWRQMQVMNCRFITCVCGQVEVVLIQKQPTKPLKCQTICE